ncbi:PolA DNA polymerase I - 3'-5' exonuclease and polymerase domains [uncultured Caudovirales phage]|uniref:PolA DNA polymerase I - 3'-5' exonuclease and polymerase domains n=1 Tax=uncultured Caudovirales phage TaxID=2100421 RepID=A0A6J5PAK8_9CAUD|nr:PolA DNA polymerase I - 3'-5' exonuclease and polymerase domains [uncultured Caudovirales phage]CAB4168543.1 PolA DNA polymerase I - 3'-5' exonuclease and polymerase domains [uncultured Caudovirales phage]CAB4196420.1 PolA DNA polymerase I - 3'-5' exonuclease and polymerase domains [uncultured Caudovirales phage]CAB4205062.1 PolA DNA polymerase I - 3'-5' exonuclease and polymerase domains [uncultured Caudovirales phage]
MRLVIDIETDLIPCTIVKCIIAKDIDTGAYYSWATAREVNYKFPEFVKLNTITFIGHNIIDFDVPTMNRLLGTDIKTEQCEDTMILSYMFYPLGKHSLAYWGEQLKFPKMEPPDFDGPVTPYMIDYCNNDVNLTHKLWNHFQPNIKLFSRKSIELEYKVRELITEQERNGFTLDCQKAMMLQARLQERAAVLKEEVQRSFLPLAVHVRDCVPRVNKDGTWNAGSIKHIEDPETVGGPHSIIEWPDFNLSSRQQIVRQLEFRGWKPTNFTEKGQAIVDETTLETLDIPEAKLIAEYLMVEKRQAQVTSWLEKVGTDGKVHGRVSTLQAISNRMGHSSPNMAQVPASYSPYGKECRECWTVSSSGYSLLGCDAASLELRGLAHYMGDPKFIKEVTEGDVHTANQKAAGLDTRDQAKTFIYALIFGAGPPKIGAIVGGYAKDGKRLIDSFLSNTPAFATLRTRVEMSAKRGYLVGMDGRRLTVRSPHAAMNLLIQGAGAVVCKQWLVEITKLYREAKLDVKLVASIHDEYQFEVRKEHAEQLGAITKLAIKNTELIVGSKCPLDSGFKIGSDWSSTH